MTRVTRRTSLVTAALVLATFGGPAASAQTVDWSVDGHDGAHIRILRDYEVPAGTTVREPVVVIGGSAVVDGEAGDVVVIGGRLRVGPTAVIRGDVVAIGGPVNIDPAARIQGEVNDTVIVGPDIDFSLGWLPDIWWPALALTGTLLRLTTILIVALLLTVVTPDWITGMAQRAASAPLLSAAVGVAGQVLALPAAIALTVVLVMSIVGALLLVGYPFLFGAALLIWAAGFTAVAANIGGAIRRKPEGTPVRVGDVLVGVILIGSLTLAAQALAFEGGAGGPAVWAARALGWLVEWIAWTIGLGAALMSVFGSRQPVVPPPLPFAAPAPTPSS